MKQQFWLAATAVLLSVAAGPASAQEKIKIGVIVTLSGPPAALGAQVRDGFALAVKDLGGKMARPRGRDHQCRRRTEARRRGDQGPRPARARQGRFRGRADLLQYPAGDPQAGHREQDLSDQPERRRRQLCRQGLQPVLLCHVLPERPGAPDPRQGGAGPRLQARLSDGAELSGRPRFRRRLQVQTSRARSSKRAICRSTPSTSSRS